MFTLTNIKVYLLHHKSIRRASTSNQFKKLRKKMEVSLQLELHSSLIDIVYVVFFFKKNLDYHVYVKSAPVLD